MTDADLKDRLKTRLFHSIAAQIDAIGHVPADLARLVGGFHFEQGMIGRATETDPAARPTPLASSINAYYDAAFYSRDGIMAILLADTDYRNIGYWDATTRTQHQASERLQDELLARIPRKVGRILDVACGMGASTRRLLHHYPPENVWAINISEKQIETTRRNAPGCHAQVMNAVDLRFDDGFFDTILCIEAAFHFNTRRRFLEEALRVLQPGGRLVLSDTLFTAPERLAQYPIFPGPENHLASADEYRALLAEVGFRTATVDDVSAQVWQAHFRYVVDRIHTEMLAGRLGIVEVTEILWTYYHLNAMTGACLFVYAEK